jgi:hypothetical protein
MQVQYQIVTGSLYRFTERAQLCEGPSRRELQRLCEVRIVPDQAGVFLFDQEVNTAVREPGAQRANER